MNDVDNDKDSYKTTTPATPPQTPLSAHRIPNLPPDFFYIPNFISKAEEAVLLEKITTAPPHRWTNLSRRRLQVYPTALTARNVLIPSAALPAWLTVPCLPRFASLGFFDGTPHGAPNHCLVNEYHRGQGIMAHEDGEAYAGVVATISLGGVVVLDIFEKEGEGRSSGGGVSERRSPRWRILQEERSVLVTRGEAYRVLLHGIAEAETDENVGPETIVNWDMLGETERFANGVVQRGTRISLTWRDVLKVSKVGEKVFGKR